MLTEFEYKAAVALVEALVEYGLTQHLAYYGDNSTERWFREFNVREAGFWFASGCTKVCIGHTDLSNWIIKVGYTETVACDYAKREYENYCHAREAGLEEYFPETIELGIFGNCAFYIQQKVECDEDKVSSDWYEALRDRYDYYGEEYDCDILADELDNMESDEKAFLLFENMQLSDFLVDNGINDLHEGNFGYIDGRAVIIDFSGYRG